MALTVAESCDTPLPVGNGTCSLPYIEWLTTEQRRITRYGDRQAEIVDEGKGQVALWVDDCVLLTLICAGSMDHYPVAPEILVLVEKDYLWPNRFLTSARHQYRVLCLHWPGKFHCSSNITWMPSLQPPFWGNYRSGRQYSLYGAGHAHCPKLRRRCRRIAVINRLMTTPPAAEQISCTS